MTVEYRVISIGALSHHRLWGESGEVRTAHATTTVVIDGDRTILVDPSLPSAVLAARFNERTGKHLTDVTDVFCTTLRTVHYRGVTALPQANWWAGEVEIQAMLGALETARITAGRVADDPGPIKEQIEIIQRFRPAPERFGPQTQLYPLVGPSAGSAGLLLTPPARTVLIAGDAVATREHLESGQVWQGCADIQAAMETFTDLIEVADIVVCGHDNLVTLSRDWL